MHMTEAEILETTYFDKATISGQIEYKKPNGATAFKEGIKAENIKCAVSKQNVSSVNQTELTNNIEYNVIMFCSPGVPIVTGDVVEVEFEDGSKKRFEAGEPFKYSSHIEVSLLRKGKG